MNGCFAGLQRGRWRPLGCLQQRPELLQIEMALRQIRPGPQALLQIAEFVGRQQAQVA